MLYSKILSLVNIPNMSGWFHGRTAGSGSVTLVELINIIDLVLVVQTGANKLDKINVVLVKNGGNHKISRGENMGRGKGALPPRPNTEVGKIRSVLPRNFKHCPKIWINTLKFEKIYRYLQKFKSLVSVYLQLILNSLYDFTLCMK